jgi:hypothetical protein
VDAGILVGGGVTAGEQALSAYLAVLPQRFVHSTPERPAGERVRMNTLPLIASPTAPNDLSGA